MAQPKIYQCEAFRNTDKALLNFISNLFDVQMGAEQIDAISYRVWQHASQCDAEAAANGTEIGEQETVSVDSAVYDDLQTGNGWPPNQGDGYNLRIVIPASRIPSAAYYRVEITITPSQTSGEDPFYIVWLIQTLPIAS